MLNTVRRKLFFLIIHVRKWNVDSDTFHRPRFDRVQSVKSSRCRITSEHRFRCWWLLNVQNDFVSLPSDHGIYFAIFQV